METDYRVAELNSQQLQAIEQMENRLGLTLIAWEPAARPPERRETEAGDLRS